MKKYLFPLNYDHANKLLGLIEYPLLVPLLCYGFLLYFLLSLTMASLVFKISFFTIFFLPIVFILSGSIHQEPVYIFLFFVLKHHFCSRRYLWDKNKVASISTPSSKSS